MDERIEYKLATNNKENVYKSGGSLSHEKVPASKSNRNWVMKGITKLKPDSKKGEQNSILASKIVCCPSTQRAKLLIKLSNKSWLTWKLDEEGSSQYLLSSLLFGEIFGSRGIRF